MSSARLSRALLRRRMPLATSAGWSFGSLPLLPHFGKSHSISLEANMSEQENHSEDAREMYKERGQESRFLTGARLEARDITATYVVSGVLEQHIHLPAQKYAPPLHRPRRAEYFQDRAREQAWLLAHLHSGRIVTICGPGGMGKTALVAEVLWMLAPGDSPPADFPDGIVFHSFYGQPEAMGALGQLARTFGEHPLPTPSQAAHRAPSGKQSWPALAGAHEAANRRQEQIGRAHV